MKGTNFPKIYLAIDNCFASKRWTRPEEWMELIKSLGVDFIEASADTEADPLYCGTEYMKDWAETVAELEGKLGVKVANLYSGHGTYTTLGLAHTDLRVQERMIEQWLKPMIDAAARIQAGLGFFCHAFPQSVVLDSEKYQLAEENLYSNLRRVGKYAYAKSVKPLCVEQMYTPHQIPWTIEGAKKLIKNLYREDGAAYYITLDTGHQTGQRKFAHLCSEEDSDTYRWLEELGCYSPIIHLQQVVGDRSAHLPFTKEFNKLGKIDPKKILAALVQSYIEKKDQLFPQKTDAIYLTLELFSGTAETVDEIKNKVRESIQYWRRFIPSDGLLLNDLINIS